MFKLFVKLLALILVLALTGPFLIKGPDGKPLIGFNDVRQTIARHWHSLTGGLRRDTGPLPVYRWQDEHGNWHYSDTANPNGASELIYVDPDINVVPASDAVAAPNAPALPGSIQEALDDAHEATESMEQRNEEMKQRTEEQR